MSATEKAAARDRVKEMENRLIYLSTMWQQTRDIKYRNEYKQLHPKWYAAKTQLRMDI